MAFADIELRDNGSNTFDISLSGGSAPTGNSNFFVFFDELFLLVMVAADSFFLFL